MTLGPGFRRCQAQGIPPTLLPRRGRLPPEETMSEHGDEFERLAREDVRPTLLSELGGDLSETRKWWLAPIIVVLLLVGLMLYMSTTPVAPFIYTLF